MDAVTTTPLSEELREAVAWLQASKSMGMLIHEHDMAGARLNLYRNGRHESSEIDLNDPNGLAKALVSTVNAFRKKAS